MTGADYPRAAVGESGELCAQPLDRYRCDRKCHIRGILCFHSFSLIVICGRDARTRTGHASFSLRAYMALERLRATQPLERLCFDLARAFAGYPQLAPHLLKRSAPAIRDAVA